MHIATIKCAMLVLTALIVVHSAEGASHLTGKVIVFDFNKGLLSNKAEDQVLTAADGTCITREIIRTRIQTHKNTYALMCTRTHVQTYPSLAHTHAPISRQ